MIVQLALSCDPGLTRLFTPLHPQLGRYEVCTTPEAIERVVAEGVTGGPAGPRDHGARDTSIDMVQALDAFGGAGPYDRSALARLYGGQRAKVARGWRQDGDRFESVTLISPYPDRSLTRLQSGTMVIRWQFTVPIRHSEFGIQNSELFRMKNASEPGALAGGL